MVSLLNGLSAMGSSIADYAGTAGLEQQKAALANQSAVLADQLATTRETTLQGQQQQFLAGQQTSSQTFQAGQNTQEQAAAASRQQAQLAVTQAEGAATRAAEKARQDALLAQPPEIIRTLRALGALPPAGATPADGGAAPAPADSGSAAPSTDTTDIPFDTGQASATPPASTSTAGVSPPSAGGSTAASPDLTSNPLVAKLMGLPQPGSEDAIRRAIAADVKADPQFKYKSAGQQGAEVENRLAIAQGKMTDPDSRAKMAQAIASYQLPPLSGFAAAKPGGPETMAQVMAINPDYQESRYPEVNKAMSAFGSGKQGDLIRANNVGVQHLDVIDQAAAALGNGNVQALNSLKNVFEQQFGAAPPTTFDGLKQIVGTEVEKAVAGGIGSSADRDRIMAALSRANSPAQLQAITDGFRSLMVGQLIGLKQQYEEATGFKSGPFAFENKLVPATLKRLGPISGDMAAPSAATPNVPAAAAPDQSTPSVDDFGRPVPSMTPPLTPPNPALLRLWGQ